MDEPHVHARDMDDIDKLADYMYDSSINLDEIIVL